jgi:hypothetical protein
VRPLPPSTARLLDWVLLSLPRCLTHPPQYLVTSGHYLLRARRASQPYYLRLHDLRNSSPHPSLNVRAFSLVAKPTMPSADFCCSFLPPLDGSSTQAEQQTSPGIARSLSRLCPPHLRVDSPYRYWTLKILAFSSSQHASYAVSVGRASVLLTASFRFHLAMDTLAVRLTIPPVRLVRDFHPLVNAPCRAHKKKGGPASGPPPSSP